MPDQYRIKLGIDNSQADATARASTRLMREYEQQCLKAARAAQAALHGGAASGGGGGTGGQAMTRIKSDADARVNTAKRVATEQVRAYSQEEAAAKAHEQTIRAINKRLIEDARLTQQALARSVTAAGVGGMHAVPKNIRAAVDDYSGVQFRSINNAMRGVYKPSNAERDRINAQARLIDQAVAAGSVAKSTVLHRGTNLQALGGLPEVGGVIKDKGFLSTSVRKDIAENFAHDVLLEIHARKGTRAADVSHLTGGGEAEVLLARNQQLRVKSRTMDEQGRFIVTAETVRSHEEQKQRDDQARILRLRRADEISESQRVKMAQAELGRGGRGSSNVPPRAVMVAAGGGGGEPKIDIGLHQLQIDTVNKDIEREKKKAAEIKKIHDKAFMDEYNAGVKRTRSREQQAEKEAQEEVRIAERAAKAKESAALGPHGRLAKQQRVALNERTIDEAAFNRAQDAHHNKLINNISKERYGYQTSFREAIKGAIGFDDAIVKLGSTMLGLGAGRAIVSSVAAAMRSAEEAGTRMAKKVIDTATALKEIALIRGKFAPDDTELAKHIGMRVASGLSQAEAVVFESELLNQLGTVSEQKFPQAERAKLSIMGAKQAARGGGGETGVETRARMLGLLPSFVQPDKAGVVHAEDVNAMADEIDRIAQMGAAKPAKSTSQAAELITRLTTEKLTGTFHDPRKAVALSTIASQFEPESSAEAALQAIRQGRDFLKFRKMKGAEAAKGETLKLAGVKETMDPAQTLVQLFEFAKANMKEDEAFDTFLLRRGFSEKRGNEKLMEFYNTYLKGEFTRIMAEADRPIDQTLPGKKFKEFAESDVGRTQLEAAKQDAAELEQGKKKREQEHGRAAAKTAYTEKGLATSPLMSWGQTLMNVPGFFVGKTGEEIELDVIALTKARREAGEPELSGPAIFREVLRADVPAEINRLRLKVQNRNQAKKMGQPILGPGAALPGMLNPARPPADHSLLLGAASGAAVNSIPGVGLYNIMAGTLKNIADSNQKIAETNAAMAKAEKDKKAVPPPPAQPIAGPAPLAGR